MVPIQVLLTILTSILAAIALSCIMHPATPLRQRSCSLRMATASWGQILRFQQPLELFIEDMQFSK